MTPAVRDLEKSEVRFALYRYDHDPAADSFGEEAARKLGIAAERVFKSLVASADNSLAMAVIPVPRRLDLKKLAAAMGVRKTELADPAAAQRATGYVLGGISPLGGKKKLPTFVDAAALVHETIWVSAGQRGLQIELRPEDLVRLTAATVTELTVSSGEKMR